jgi:DedD protein
MGLLSFLKRTAGDTPKAMPVTESVDSVQQARTRARQRLIGAVVLVTVGVIGFSLLFETQPRPVAVDVPIEIARRDGAPATQSTTPPPTRRNPPVETPAPRSEMPTETAAEAGREVPPPSTEATPAERPAATAPVRTAASAPEPRRPESRAAAASAPVRNTADAARAQALLDGREGPAASGRFVVQVGAFAESTAAREARQKVEKLGLKTYMQVVETSAGKRTRVRAGPFASRDEAERAASKIKSTGLPSSVLTL